MNNCVLRLLILFLCLAGLQPGAAQSIRMDSEIPQAPASRVYDPDNIYRAHPESLTRISEGLVKLKNDYDFDIYLVVYSGMIGKNAVRLADRYHEEWLSEKNDGLVFVMDIQSITGGTTGRSRNLYQGDYMEEGLMPRIMLADINVIVQEASLAMSEINEMDLKIDYFITDLVKRMSERLEADRALNPVKDGVNFMGMMAIGLLVVGLLVAIASKLLGRSDNKKAGRLYRFPDVLVGERLGAPNGGGKVSVIDFGRPSGQ